MIKHIVCHKIDNKQKAQKAADMLNELQRYIPELVSMCAGVDVLGSHRSYELGIVAEFESLDGLKIYDEHPKHLEVREYILSVKDKTYPSVAVDFEF